VAVAAKSNPTAKSKAAAGPADPKPAAESDDDAATTDGKDDTPTLAAKLVCALPPPPHPLAGMHAPGPSLARWGWPGSPTPASAPACTAAGTVC
jgi:hypothetical protein